MEKRIQIRNTNRCWLQLLFDSFKWRSLSEIHTLQAIIMFCLTYFELSRFQTENGSLSCENNLKVLHFLKFFFSAFILITLLMFYACIRRFSSNYETQTTIFPCVLTKNDQTLSANLLKYFIFLKESFIRFASLYH